MEMYGLYGNASAALVSHISLKMRMRRAEMLPVSKQILLRHGMPHLPEAGESWLVHGKGLVLDEAGRRVAQRGRKSHHRMLVCGQKLWHAGGCCAYC